MRRRHVASRGFSWIVEPLGEEVVIAIEIPMGAAVAGPFAIEQERLDQMIRRVIAAAAAPGRQSTSSSEGLRPSDSPTASLARRFAAR